MERVNPGHLNDDELFQEAPRITEDCASHYLAGIKSAIDHMHSLVLVHNYINPNNIMITQDDRIVIIDHDSCLPNGALLGQTKRIFQWHDPSVQFSQFSNDELLLKNSVPSYGK